MTIFDRLKDWWLGTPKAQTLPAPNTQDEIIVIQADPALATVAVVETPGPVAQTVVVVTEPAVVQEPVVEVAQPVAVVAEPAVEPAVEPVVEVAHPVVEVSNPAKGKKARKPKAETVATSQKVSKKKHK